MKRAMSVFSICILLSSVGGTNLVYANGAKQKEVSDKLELNREEQENLSTQILELDSQIEEMTVRIADTESKIEELLKEITATEYKIDVLKVEIKTNEDALGKRLKAINGKYSMGYLKVVLSSSSISEFLTNLNIVKEVVSQDKQMLKDLDDAKEKVEKEMANLKSKKQEQEALKVSLDNDNTLLNESKKELEDLKKVLEEEEDALESELEKLIIENSLKYNFDLSGVVLSTGDWPIPNHTRISSPYGYRIHPILKVRKMHTGIDIPAPTGTPIVSVDNGVVIFAGVKGGYGNTLMIKHDDGKISLYAHCNELVAYEGQRVSKGEVVAKVGSTGRSTGPHLHFEIRIGNKHVDPMLFVSNN